MMRSVSPSLSSVSTVLVASSWGTTPSLHSAFHCGLRKDPHSQENVLYTDWWGWVTRPTQESDTLVSDPLGNEGYGGECRFLKGNRALGADRVDRC